MMFSLLTHIWVIRPHWVDKYIYIDNSNNKYNNIVDNDENDIGHNEEEEEKEVEGIGWEGVVINTLRPRQMAAIFQTTFANAFS